MKKLFGWFSLETMEYIVMANLGVGLICNVLLMIGKRETAINLVYAFCHAVWLSGMLVSQNSRRKTEKLGNEIDRKLISFSTKVSMLRQRDVN